MTYIFVVIAKGFILKIEMQLKVVLLLCLVSLSLALESRTHEYRSTFRYSDFLNQVQSQRQTPASALAVSITFFVLLLILALAYFLFCPQHFQRNPKQFSSQNQGKPTLDQNISANVPVRSQPPPPQPQPNFNQSVRGTLVNANRAVNPYINPGTDRQSRF